MAICGLSESSWTVSTANIRKFTEKNIRGHVVATQSPNFALGKSKFGWLSLCPQSCLLEGCTAELAGGGIVEACPVLVLVDLR